MNFYILFLPYESPVSLNWFLNYCFQFCLAFVGCSSFYALLSIMLYIMNHTCWAFDDLIILVDECNSTAQNLDPSDNSLQDSVGKQLKTIVEKSCKILEWQEEARNLFKFVFFVDFTMQSFMSALCLVTLATDIKASSFIYTMLVFIMTQLLTNCWMGERTIGKIGMLTSAIYDLPWYLMSAKQRKKVQMILIMSQNMRGFNGIFKEVNMETFQAVWK